MQATLRKRFDSAGLLFSGGYTLSKSLDNLSTDPVAATTGGGLTSTAARTPADGRNYRNERGRSDFDQRHVLNASGIYELPFGKGKPLFRDAGRPLDLIVGGWSLNAIYTYQSGEPFTIRSGFLTANGTAQSRAALAPGVTTLPEAKLQDKAGVIGPVFFQDASAFAAPAPGQLGLGRNIFQGPSYWNIDLGISKGFQLSERFRLTFRTEMFNALNHANFRNPRDASVGSPAIKLQCLRASLLRHDVDGEFFHHEPERRKLARDSARPQARFLKRRRLQFHPLAVARDHDLAALQANLVHVLQAGRALPSQTSDSALRSSRWPPATETSAHRTTAKGPAVRV